MASGTEVDIFGHIPMHNVGRRVCLNKGLQTAFGLEEETVIKLAKSF